MHSPTRLRPKWQGADCEATGLQVVVTMSVDFGADDKPTAKQQFEALRQLRRAVLMSVDPIATESHVEACSLSCHLGPCCYLRTMVPREPGQCEWPTLPPGATETSWPRLLQTSMSGSFVLPQLVSVLMSLAYDATKGHTAIQSLGHTMLVSVLCCQPGQVFLSGQCCQLGPCESFGSWVSGPQKSPMESKESKSKTQTDQQTNKQTNKQLHTCAPSPSAPSGILVTVNPSFDDLCQKLQQVSLHK